MLGGTGGVCRMDDLDSGQGLRESAISRPAASSRSTLSPLDTLAHIQTGSCSMGGSPHPVASLSGLVACEGQLVERSLLVSHAYWCPPAALVMLTGPSRADVTRQTRLCRFLTSRESTSSPPLSRVGDVAVALARTLRVSRS